MINAPRTLEEHREYLYEIVRLKYHFLHRVLAEHPEEDFTEAMNTRIDIFRKTDLNPEGLNPRGVYWDMPEWVAFVEEIRRIYLRNRDDIRKFEEEAFQCTRPHLDARVWRDWRDRSAPGDNQCGFLRVARPGTRLPGVALIHIVNTKVPDSFFDYPEYMRECFQKACDVAEGFGVTEIGCESWLNGVPQWLAWFPEEWAKNRSECNTDVRWHFGFWGQMINARGCFNRKAGEYLRKTGKFPYYPSYAHCSIEALRRHQSAMKGKTPEI